MDCKDKRGNTIFELAKNKKVIEFIKEKSGLKQEDLVKAIYSKDKQQSKEKSEVR